VLNLVANNTSKQCLVILVKPGYKLWHELISFNVLERHPLRSLRRPARIRWGQIQGRWKAALKKMSLKRGAVSWLQDGLFRTESHCRRGTRTIVPT
jgi:hypothetical protein